MEDVAYEVYKTSRLHSPFSSTHPFLLCISIKFSPNAEGWFCSASSLVAGAMWFNPGASEKE